jgi:hypothetical protein
MHIRRKNKPSLNEAWLKEHKNGKYTDNQNKSTSNMEILKTRFHLNIGHFLPLRALEVVRPVRTF